MAGKHSSHDASNTETVTREDDDVGQSGGSAAGGGHQTAQQAAVTGMGGGGRSDADRREGWDKAGSAGRGPPAMGGSSDGQSDRKPAAEGEGS